MTPAGFPHSDIPGSKLVCSSPRLIAAYRVLHRLLVPRHPPCALSSLTGFLPKVLPFVAYPASHIRLSKIGRDGLASRADAPLQPGCSREIYVGSRQCRPASLVSGGDSGARTRSLRLAKPALSQLSYIPGNQGFAATAPHPERGGPGWTRTTHLTLIRRAL
jgi:hypothetical protein